MKIVLLYTRVLGKSDPASPDPSYYHPFTERFIATYSRFKPDTPHSLIVCNCGISGNADGLFDDFAEDQLYYNGPGWDIGAYQYAASKVEADLIFFIASPVHFWRKGWMEPFVEAARSNGPGIYAPMASYENSPHMRTGVFAAHPKLMRDYPIRVNSRPLCVVFESLPAESTFTSWAIQNNYPAMMVTQSECYNRPDWRKPPNIFRRGDQSNCLIWDRHTDIYASADPATKSSLELAANGGVA